MHLDLASFYPLVLRYFFGTRCYRLNRSKAVFAAGAISMVLNAFLSYVANRKVLKEPKKDTFMKILFIKAIVVVVLEFVVSYKKGPFIYGMYTCWKVGPDNFDPSFA